MEVKPQDAGGVQHAKSGNVRVKDYEV